MNIETAYEILGVTSRSTQEEVTKAYKVAALKTHPDKNLDDPQASQKFIDVSNAYEKITNHKGGNDEDEQDDDDDEYCHFRHSNPSAFFDFMFFNIFGERFRRPSNSFDYDDFEKEYAHWAEMRAKHIEENRRVYHQNVQLKKSMSGLGLTKRSSKEDATRAFNALSMKYDPNLTPQSNTNKEKYDEIKNWYDVVLANMEEKAKISLEREQIRLASEKTAKADRAKEKQRFEEEREARGRNPFRDIEKDLLRTCHKCSERYVPQKDQRCDSCGAAEPELQALIDAEKAAKKNKGKKVN